MGTKPVSDFHKNKNKNTFLENISPEHILKQAGGIPTRTLLERIFRVKHSTKYFMTSVQKSKNA